MRVDLYADGEFGQWVLSHVAAEEVGRVLTTDSAVEALARQRRFDVILGSPGCVSFENQPVGMSAHYHRVLPPDYLTRYEKIYNIHPGFLPWGRGYYPVFWALWEQTFAGATLHEITAGLDKGPIISQIRIPYSITDTGGTLYARVRQAEQELFLKYWPRIQHGEDLPSFPQPKGGSYHSKAEFFELKNSAPWSSMSGADLVRLTLAFAFPGHSGFRIELDGRGYEIVLQDSTIVE